MGLNALVKQVASELRSDWHEGHTRPVEEYFARYPTVSEDEAAACELVYHEYRVRQELGQETHASDYMRRFPQWAPRLVELFLEHATSRPAPLPDTQILGAVIKAPQDTIAEQPPLPSETTDHAYPTVGIDSNAAPSERTVRQVGDYELIEEIARGGMGVVFKARQARLNRIVAVKMILAGQLASDDLVRRFYSEATAAASLDHPGIVPIYEVNEHEGQHYFSMGYVEGTSLSTRISQGPLGHMEAAELVRHIAEAVHYAHQRGVIHRDLKPQNVLLTADGQPKVTDFGLAKSVHDDSGLTATGQVLGTPSYMPPEQAAGKLSELDSRSDTYSLGAILYCSLTGRPPFQAPSIIETLNQVLKCEPVSPRQINSSVSVDLETICLKCLQKDPRDRFASAQELADELERFIHGDPIHSRPIGALHRGWRWCRRKPLAAGLMMSVLLLATVIPAALWIAGQAWETRQMAALQNDFEEGLTRPQLSAAYLQRMQLLINNAQRHDTGKAQEWTQRLDERFAKTINSAIQAPKLTENDITHIERAVQLLKSKDASRADRLTQALSLRMSAWQTRFELDSPFTNLTNVFPETSVTLHKGAVLPHGQAEAGEHEPATVATCFECTGRVRYEAVFGPEWESTNQIGLTLGGATSHYSFRLRAARRGEDRDIGNDPQQGATFRQFRTSNRTLTAEILRNGQVVQRLDIPAATLPSNNLQLWVERNREELSFEVNRDNRLAFLDPFPLPPALGAFSILWPEDVSLIALRGLERASPKSSSALEQADQLFDRVQFRDAFELYQNTIINSADSSYRQEARFKGGLCLVELERIDEAASLFEPLMLEEGVRWPALAGFRLWLLRLEQGRGADADAIYEHLATRYKSERLAGFIPSTLREQIFSIYRKQLTTLTGLLQFNPDRVHNLERAVAIDQFLSSDGLGNPNILIYLADAYDFQGDLDRAMAIVASVVQRDRRVGTLRTYFRLMRFTGKAKEVPGEVERAIRDDYAELPQDYALLLIESVRAYATLGDFEQAESEVDRVLALDNVVRERGLSLHPTAQSDAYLLKGLLLRRRGHIKAAQEIWRQGLKAHREMGLEIDLISATSVNLLMLGSLTGELSDREAAEIVNSSSLNGLTPFLGVVKGLLTPQTAANALRGMWNTPRGLELAYATAFQSKPRGERTRLPVVLTGTEYFRQNAFGGQLSSQQDEVVWSTLHEVYVGIVDRGDIAPAQVVQLGLAWKGTTNVLGWAGVAPTLTPQLRLSIGYILAHRYLRLNKPQQSEIFLQDVVKKASQDSVLHRLALQDVTLLRERKGRCEFINEAGQPVDIRITQSGNEFTTLVVEELNAVNLPPGSYQLHVTGAEQELEIEPQQVSLKVGGRHDVTIRRRWRPGPTESAVPGLAARPSPLKDVGRWQVATKQLRGSRVVHVFDGDGSRSAVVATDGIVRLLMDETGQKVRALSGHRAAPYVLALSPNGEWLATCAAYDHNVRVWRVEDGSLRQSLPILSPRALAWSSKSDRLAVSSFSSKITIWQPDGMKVQSWEGHAAQLRFTPDDTRLAGLTNDGRIALWPLEHPDEVETLDIADVITFAFSRDGQFVAIATKSGLLLVLNFEPPAVGGPLWQIEQPNIIRLVFSADGQRLVAGSTDGIVSFYAVSDGAAQWISPKARTVLDIVERPSGQWLVSDLNGIRQLDSSGKVDVVKEWHRDRLSRVAFDLPRNRIVAALLGTRHPQIWSLDGQLLLDAANAGAAPYSTAISPDGSLVIGVGTDYKAKLWDAGTGDVVHSLPNDIGSASPHGTAFSPDSARFAIGGYTTKSVRVWDRNGVLQWSKTDFPDVVSAVTFSRDGKHLLVGTGRTDKSIYVFAAADGELLEVRPKQHSGIHQLCASPIGESIASCSDNGMICLWKIGGSDGLVFRAHAGGARCIAFHPQEEWIVSVGADGACQLWQLDGTPMRGLSSSLSPLTFVACSADGCQIFAAADDGVIHVWDSDTGQRLRTLALLGADQAATIDMSGELLSATVNAKDKLWYLVERADRGFDTLNTSEFERLMKKN